MGLATHLLVRIPLRRGGYLPDTACGASVPDLSRLVDELDRVDCLRCRKTHLFERAKHLCVPECLGGVDCLYWPESPCSPLFEARRRRRR